MTDCTTPRVPDSAQPDRVLEALARVIENRLPGAYFALVLFNPDDREAVPELLANASATDLENALGHVLARLLIGEFRMPIDGGMRWPRVPVA